MKNYLYSLTNEVEIVNTFDKKLHFIIGKTWSFKE